MIADFGQSADRKNTDACSMDMEQAGNGELSLAADNTISEESDLHLRTEQKSAADSSARRRIGLIAAGIAGVLLLMVSAVLFLYFGMVPVLDQEYGYGMPEASLFYPGHACSYREVPDNAEDIGLHWCLIDTDRGVRIVWVRVRDTIAPAAGSTELTISATETVTPDQLIRDLADKDLVKISFLKTPPFGEPGEYETVIVLEDRSGNRRTVSSFLSIRMTRERVTVEAGSKAPDATAFLLDPNADATCSDITESMLHIPGEYPVGITVQGKTYASLLEVVDTIPPKGSTKMLLRIPGESIRPEEFLINAEDETELEITYQEEPDPDRRDLQSVMIRLSDRGGNYTDLSASVLYTHATPVIIEARDTPLAAQECLSSESTWETASFSVPFIPDTVGTYALRLTVDGDEDLALVEVRDTVPPIVEADSFTWYLNHPLDPAALCKTVRDITETTVHAEPEIDWSREGVQNVELIAVDAGGNASRTSLSLTLNRDTESPKIYGVIDRNAYVGEPIAYFAEVFATDNLDEDLTISIDVSKVDQNKAGSYPVIYSVTDMDGNTATATCRFKFTNASVSDEEVEALAKSVLAEIFRDDMTKTEQLEAIFNYVRNHVHYVGSSDKNDWRKEAKRGIETGKGDCFTFYSVTRALLDQTDVDYMSVTRKGSKTRHYWVIVNIGTGWYHFDPTIAPEHKHRCFMWTNKQCKVKPYFWRFEESKYPKIAETLFDKDAAIAAERAGTLGTD